MFRVYLLSFIAWLFITAGGLALRRRRAGRYLLRFSYVIFLLFCVEFACVAAFYVKNRRWTFDDQRVYLRRLFEPHPYMVGVPRKSVSVTMRGITYTHNSQGFRGREFPPKSEKVRVVTLGGSTTYGANVSDEETWPFYLGQMLGPGYEVLNFGVLGYSTVEHINQAALLVPEYRPDVLVVHAGLNDLRNMHVKDLAPDYSDYHAPSLYGGLGLCAESELQNFASVKAATWLLKRAGVYPECAFDQIDAREDLTPASEEYARHLYRRNLTTLVTIARQQGLKVILVPQILVREKFEGGRLRWWIPFVEDEKLVAYLNEYNAVMREVAEREGVRYAGEVLEQPWTADDFADPSHLNAAGDRKFAAALQPAVAGLHLDAGRAP